MTKGQYAHGGYVRLRRDPIRDLAAKHDLSLAEQGLLFRLLLYVDSRSPELHTTQAELAVLVGIHRTRLPRVLDRLVEAGAVEYRFPKGHQGVVRVVAYDDLVGGS